MYAQVINLRLTIAKRQDHQDPHAASFARIQAVVADHYGFTAADLTGPTRPARIARARQEAMYLCRCLILHASLREIGDAFGRRDHGTVIHACKVITARLAANASFRARLDQITASLTNA